jgi:hypothetical protein
MKSRGRDFSGPIELKSMTTIQEQAIELLISGMPTKAVAAKVGLHVGTIYNWQWKDEEFKKGLAEADRIKAEEIRWAYRALAPLAVTAYEKALKGKNCMASIKAAASILRTQGAEWWEPQPEQLQHEKPTAGGIKIEVVKAPAPAPVIPAPAQAAPRLAPAVPISMITMAFLMGVNLSRSPIAEDRGYRLLAYSLTSPIDMASYANYIGRGWPFIFYLEDLPRSFNSLATRQQVYLRVRRAEAAMGRIHSHAGGFWARADSQRTLERALHSGPSPARASVQTPADGLNSH